MDFLRIYIIFWEDFRDFSKILEDHQDFLWDFEGGWDFHNLFILQNFQIFFNILYDKDFETEHSFYASMTESSHGHVTPCIIVSCLSFITALNHQLTFL